MTLRIIQGQETPERLGWRIHDTTAHPWPVPTYEWQADRTFCRAWIIQMQADESQWPVLSAEAQPTGTPGELRIIIHRRDGGTDHLLRRFPGQPPVEFQGETVTGDVVVFSSGPSSTRRARLEMKDGQDSVGKPILPANTQTTGGAGGSPP